MSATEQTDNPYIVGVGEIGNRLMVELQEMGAIPDISKVSRVIIDLEAGKPARLYINTLATKRTIDALIAMVHDFDLRTPEPESA